LGENRWDQKLQKNGLQNFYDDHGTCDGIRIRMHSVDNVKSLIAIIKV
jgi:hypothetical protein